MLRQAIKAKFIEDENTSGTWRLILAVTLPGKKSEIDAGYKMREIVSESDFVSIRAFDLRTAEDRKVGLSSAFLADPDSGGIERTLNFQWVARYYLSMGLPKEKLNLGVATYGRTFELLDETNSRLGAVAVDFGNVGPWSAMTGILGRYEICQSIWTGGTVVNVYDQGGRYHVKGNQWVSYEDNLSVAQKACYIKEEEFGGVTFWTLDFDDFSGHGCREGQYPLISTALHVLTTNDDSVCSSLNTTNYLKSPANRSTEAIYSGTEDQSREKMRVICYIQNWAYHRKGRGLFVPENIDPKICTHIVYAYAAIKDMKIVPFIRNEESEPWREGLFERLMNSKLMNPELKILIAVGGDGVSRYMRELPSDSSTLKTFGVHVVEFLRQKKFDGFELTWEVPERELKDKYLSILKTLKVAFDEEATSTGNPRLILSVGMPAGKAKIDVYGHDILEIEKTVDYMSVMTYDFHGSWDPFTGLNSPLYHVSYESAENRQLNMDWVGRYYFSLGLSKRNINLGIPTYGRSFTLQNPNYNGLYDSVSGAGTPGLFTGRAGLLAYYEVCEFITQGAQTVVATEQRAPYAYMDSEWVSFENIESVTDKACYITKLRFGGVNIWALDLDDFLGLSCDEGKFPLVGAVYNIVQYIDISKCSNFKLMYATAAAEERGLPGQYLKYMNLIVVLLLTLYSAFK